jgi:hypothetical protein
MLDQGVWAEVKVADEHLRLFAEHNALGVQASVYNVIAKTWIAPSEPVDDLEQGKERAAAHAQQYLKRVGNWRGIHASLRARWAPEAAERTQPMLGVRLTAQGKLAVAVFFPEHGLSSDYFPRIASRSSRIRSRKKYHNQGKQLACAL